MPIISGPLGTLAVALMAVTGLIAWLLRDRRYRGPRLLDDERPGVDRRQLEAAEEEVRRYDASRSIWRSISPSDAQPLKPKVGSRSARKPAARPQA